MTTTLAYIASKEQSKRFKIETQDIPTIRVGIHAGLETNPHYFETLGDALLENKAGIDLVVFDQNSITEVVGTNNFIAALLNYVKMGITDNVGFVIIDKAGIINTKGRDLFTRYGIRVIADIGELGPVFRVKEDIRNEQDLDAGVLYDDTGNVIAGTVPEYDMSYSEEQRGFPPSNTSNMNQDNLYDETPEIYNVSDPQSQQEQSIPETPLPDYTINKSQLDPFEQLYTPPMQNHDSNYGNYYDQYYNNTPYYQPPQRYQDQYDMGYYDPTIPHDYQQEYRPEYPQDFRNDYRDEYHPQDEISDYQQDYPVGYPETDQDEVPVIHSSHTRPDLSDEYQEQDDYQYQQPPYQDYNSQNNYYGYGSNNPDYQDMDNRLPSYGHTVMPQSQYDNLTEGFTGELSQEDIEQLLSIKEPQWDYSELNADFSQHGLFKKNRGKRLGEVSSASFANSSYIPQQKELHGYYTPPNESKIISCFSCAGGSGKTTVATMISAQLNWYFNRNLMMSKTTSQSFRVLCLSLNEFDDIAVKDIGYTNLSGDENDGKNVAELKNRIEECNGEPEWDDIAHCFAASPSNYVFYLPSLTLRERLESKIDITAEDYKQIIEVCSRFFQFIILDCPDTIYDQRNGLMEFAFRISDIIVFVIEADTKNTIYLHRVFDGWRSTGIANPLGRDKCMLVVNKYATPDNPYRPYQPERGQIPFEKIAKATRKYFCCIEAIPLTEYRSYGNILFGHDPKVKQAAATITDDILNMIDVNDERTNKKKKKMS